MTGLRNVTRRLRVAELILCLALFATCFPPPAAAQTGALPHTFYMLEIYNGGSGEVIGTTDSWDVADREVAQGQYMGEGFMMVTEVIELEVYDPSSNTTYTVVESIEVVDGFPL